MKQNCIETLPVVLKSHIKSLSRISAYNSGNSVMTESKITAINFDKIPNEFARGKNYPTVPKSNDALYIADDSWYFIEFKSGSIDKSEIFKKIYDSLMMLIDMHIISDYQFVRDHICYILVYNEGKYSTVQTSDSRAALYNHTLALAKTEERLFEIEKFEGYLFKETHTYTQKMFEEKFISVMELNEQNGNKCDDWL